MNIALDHDGTYTACPELWKAFIDGVRASGGEVFCITSRFPNVPIHGFPGKVFYTCGQMKAEWAHENGIKVDIWIDDMPSCIGSPPGMLIEPAQAAQRRQLVKHLFDHMTFHPDGNVVLGSA